MLKEILLSQAFSDAIKKNRRKALKHKKAMKLEEVQNKLSKEEYIEVNETMMNEDQPAIEYEHIEVHEGTDVEDMDLYS